MIKRFLAFALILILLAPPLLIQGCSLFIMPSPEPAQTETSPTGAEAPPPPSISPASPQTNGRFTLRYDPDSALNPITTTSSDNFLLSSLMYESLFVIDGSLNAEAQLCDNWTRDDDYTYTFEIKPDIAMSDGSAMTADDVAYTLKQAMQKGRFINRLHIIKSVVSDGDLTVKVELSTLNSQFIRLLDVPIIKYGSIDNNVPPGSGPYIFAGPQSSRLDIFTKHRNYLLMPVTTIYLRACDDNEVAELFDDGAIALLWDDPSDTREMRLNRLHDKRFYETTELQFLGFNMRSAALRDPDVRRAIGCAVDRKYIAENIMPRQALAAPLAISPAYSLYDIAWESTYYDPQREMAELLVRAGLSDFDEDTFLEYPDGLGGFQKFSIDFIVNSENPYKIQVANMIADTLKRTGFDITVRELPWDSFTAALKSGDFDIYYGEIVLGADFDLSTLLLPNSKHNYGGTGSTDYLTYIDDFLSAKTDVGVKAAAKQLCDEISQEAPFVPIIYKRYAIYTPSGAISGMSPSISGIFSNFTDWTIDFTMLS